MITKASDHSDVVTATPLCGDLIMLLQFKNSTIFKELYMGDASAWWKCFVWLLSIKVELFAQFSRFFFRINHGKNTIGWLTLIWTISMVITFNSVYGLVNILAYIPMLFAFVFMLLHPDEIYSIAVSEIHSPALLFLTGIYGCLGIIHIVRIYLGAGNVSNHKQRGTSLLHSLFSRFFTIKESHVKCLIEPALIASIALSVKIAFQDERLFFFLILSAVCLFLQEFADEAQRYILRKS